MRPAAAEPTVTRPSNPQIPPSSPAYPTAPCAVCTQERRLDDLVDLGSYPLCQGCLRSVAADVAARRRRRFRKIEDGKQISGVCGGLADAANMDRETFRALFVLVGALTGFVPAIVAYVVLAFVMPTEGAPARP